MMNIRNIRVLKAQGNDAKLLTEISFTAKKHWNYPDEYFEIWKDELTITKEYITKNIVYKACLIDSILGFYSIIENESDFQAGEVFVEKGFWLEHIFIKPAYHKMGIGKLLINHAKQVSREMGITYLLIFVDPYAKGFYDKIDANFLYNSKSSIPDRFIPVYRLETIK